MTVSESSVRSCSPATGRVRLRFLRGSVSGFSLSISLNDRLNHKNSSLFWLLLLSLIPFGWILFHYWFVFGTFNSMSNTQEKKLQASLLYNEQ